MAIITDNIQARDVIPSSVPATKVFAITKSDTNYLSETLNSVEHAIATRYLMVNVAGNVNVVFAGQALADAVVLTLLAGVLYPFAVKMVLSTSTTATGITGYK